MARLVAIALLLAGLAWAGTRLDWQLIGRYLASASVPAVIAMAVAYTIGQFIRPLRMLILIRAMFPISWSHYGIVWAADAIAMAANCIAPMRAGDAIIPFILRRQLGTSAARVFPILIVDRFFDFATVVGIFVSTLVAAPTVAPWADHAIFALLAGLALVVFGLWLAIHKREFWAAILDRLESHRTPNASGGWTSKVRDLLGGFKIVDNVRTVAPALVLSILQWSMTTLSYWLGAIAIFPQTSPIAAAFTAAAVALSFVIPLTPAGIGIFQAAAILALSLYGVPAESALAISIVVHAVFIVCVFMIALFALIIQRVGVRSLTSLRDGDT